MSIIPFVGTYIVSVDDAASTNPIGAGIEVKVEKPGTDYSISSNSSDPIWANVVGRLDGGFLTGSLSTTPSTPFSIEMVSGQPQIKCSYGAGTSETGSWTADDEGEDRDI